ncbi:phage recombination protein Bet [Candidatus Bartonella washoeensis]|uniref:Phage recombination protein Bet n=1 Tax=Candidatus Bartonella washoeensis Sb944nv TaxID=1094563 RepID=J0YV38_9HYPH|nr:RecT family recombinase [Bartonella washoeensis]EJF78898.1 phage recombination protein Bet [Bartonella washoeensis Sb944nv]SPU26476.1 phage recombination protein Bet [Bartonella washoeensis]SPU26554.1 phage recombination protein Bet [Bartonella washoeensis]
MTNSTFLTEMAEKYGFTAEEFRTTIMKTCIGDKNASVINNAEFATFLFVAKTYGLNPLTKEIYVFPKKGGGMIPVVSIDGWIKIIKSNPDFDGMTFQDQLDKDGNLIAIKCAIRLKGIKDPIEVTEYLKECQQDHSDPWKKYPARMLRHKATIQCARYAFGFSGIYEEDEAKRINEINHNVQTKLVSYDVLTQIKQLINITQTEEEKVLDYAQVDRLEDLPDEIAQRILDILQKRQNEKEQQSLPPQEKTYTPVAVLDAEYIHIQDVEYAPIQQEQQMGV